MYGNLLLKVTSFKIAQDVCIDDDSQHPKPNVSRPCLPDLLDKISDLLMDNGRCTGQPIKPLILRQQITEMVMSASLQVDGFLAEIDSESNHIRAVKDYLTDRQTRKLNKGTLWNDSANAGAAAGSAFALGTAAAVTAGNWLAAVAGGAGAILGFVNYFETNRSPKGCFPTNQPDKKTPAHCVPLECFKKIDRACSPAMLASFFTDVKPAIPLPPCPNGKPCPLFHSDYDRVIKEYLEKTSQPGGEKGEKEKLMEDWELVNTPPEDLHKTPPEDLYKTPSKNLYVSNENPQKISLDDLNDRRNKLSDLRAVVSRANRDLSRLTEDLARDLQFCPDPDAVNFW